MAGPQDRSPLDLFAGVTARVLDLLLELADPASGREIARRLDLAPTTVMNALKQLESQGAVRRQGSGRAQLWDLNVADDRVQAILAATQGGLPASTAYRPRVSVIRSDDTAHANEAEDIASLERSPEPRSDRDITVVKKVPTQEDGDRATGQGPRSSSEGSEPIGITAEQAEWFARACGVWTDQLANVVVGTPSALKLALTGLLSGGHLLIEGPPGTGKTTLAKALISSVACSNARVQCSPDLTGSDITGVSIYNQREQFFEFHSGPIFANMVLLDEINRMRQGPRNTALLEVMEERHVTVDGTRHEVGSPFTLLATQSAARDDVYPLSPIELDRFLIRVKMEELTGESLVAVLEEAAIRDRMTRAQPIITGAAVAQMIMLADRVYVDTVILEYVSRLVIESRAHPALSSGISIRGSLALIRSAKTWALSDGRTYVIPSDIHDLWHPVAGHRVWLEDEVETSDSAVDDVLDEILESVATPKHRARRR